MHSRQLRYFLAVAEHGSFTTAATKIGIAQPALSAQVAKLEASLGCKLFDRHARGITLTRAGQHLRTEAISIIEHLNRAERETRLIGRTCPQECTIGLPPCAANALAVPLVAAVAEMFPRVSLCILDAMGGILREWYADGRLDLAMLYRVPDEPLLYATSLISENFYVATSKSSGISLGRELRIDELLSIPLIVSTARNAHRQLLESIARRRGRALNVAAEIDSMNGQRKLVLMGAGAAVLPFGDFAEWPTERLDLVPVRSEEMTASLLLVCGRHARDNPVVRSLERVIVGLVHKLAAEGTWPGARILAEHPPGEPDTGNGQAAPAAAHFAPESRLGGHAGRED